MSHLIPPRRVACVSFNADYLDKRLILCYFYVKKNYNLKLFTKILTALFIIRIIFNERQSLSTHENILLYTAIIIIIFTVFKFCLSILYFISLLINYFVLRVFLM